MPQFDTSVFGSQIVWTLVCFALLVSGMYAFIMPRFWRVRQQRQEMVNSHHDQANAIRQQAETLFRSTQEALQQTRQEAQRMIEQAEQTVKDNAHRVRLEEERLSTQQMHRVRADMAQAVIDTTGQLQKEVAQLACMTIDQWACPDTQPLDHGQKLSSEPSSDASSDPFQTTPKGPPMGSHSMSPTTNFTRSSPKGLQEKIDKKTNDHPAHHPDRSIDQGGPSSLSHTSQGPTDD